MILDLGKTSWRKRFVASRSDRLQTKLRDVRFHQVWQKQMWER
jgi:hypothetical protein